MFLISQEILKFILYFFLTCLVRINVEALEEVSCYYVRLSYWYLGIGLHVSGWTGDDG
jgi:hypothetical protein